MAKIDVQNLIGEYLTENGLDIYHSEFKKEGKDWYLRVFLDRTDGDFVSTDDCEKVSRYLSDRLDEEDPISQNYILEVSSPGLDRQLYEEKDYDRFLGQIVDVKLYSAAYGDKEHQGILKAYDNGDVLIDAQGEERRFTKDQIARVNLAVIF